MTNEPKEAEKTITEEEYFRLDDESEEKLAFYHGEIFAMVGASFAHNLICTNLIVHLNDRLPDSCYFFVADMRVQVEKKKHDTYPDVVVVCEEPEFLDNETKNTLLNPYLIVEVLSKSTQSFDRGDKFLSYRKIGSLKHYILVDQYRVHVEHFFKNERGHWELEEKESSGESIKLKDLGRELNMDAVYKRISLEGPRD